MSPKMSQIDKARDWTLLWRYWPLPWCSIWIRIINSSNVVFVQKYEWSNVVSNMRGGKSFDPFSFLIFRISKDSLYLQKGRAFDFYDIQVHFWSPPTFAEMHRHKPSWELLLLNRLSYLDGFLKCKASESEIPVVMVYWRLSSTQPSFERVATFQLDWILFHDHRPKHPSCSQTRAKYRVWNLWAVVSRWRRWWRAALSFYFISHHQYVSHSSVLFRLSFCVHLDQICRGLICYCWSPSMIA